MKIATLGPEYSFSHLASMEAMPEAELIFYKRIEDVFREVAAGKVEQGIVPLENMLHGTVRETLTSLKKYRVKINRSYNFPIHHCLAAQDEDYIKVASHPQALAQCSKFLRGKDTVEQTSTSKAMELAAQDSSYAAVGAKEAAEHYGLKVLEEKIEDNHDNVTRFLLISNEEAEENGEARTSLIIKPREDRSGLLFQILSPFAVQGINLTKIESLPSGRKLGEYLFYLEISGNVNDRRVKGAIGFLETIMEVYSFGSYKVVDLG